MEARRAEVEGGATKAAKGGAGSEPHHPSTKALAAAMQRRGTHAVAAASLTADAVKLADFDEAGNEVRVGEAAHGVDMENAGNADAGESQVKAKFATALQQAMRARSKPARTELEKPKANKPKAGNPKTKNPKTKAGSFASNLAKKLRKTAEKKK